MGDVKGLILFILKHSGTPLGKEDLTEIVLSDGLVDYFDFTEALQELLESGLVDIAAKDDARLILSSLGRQTEEIYENDLPYNVRKKNLAATMQVLSRIKRDSNTRTHIEKTEKGYLVTCSLTEDQTLLLEYSVLVPDEMQAYMIADRFVKHPTEKYQAILSLLIDKDLFS